MKQKPKKEKKIMTREEKNSHYAGMKDEMGRVYKGDLVGTSTVSKKNLPKDPADNQHLHRENLRRQSGAGKGDGPRNCLSRQFKNNFDEIKWSGKTKSKGVKIYNSKYETNLSNKDSDKNMKKKTSKENVNKKEDVQATNKIPEKKTEGKYINKVKDFLAKRGETPPEETTTENAFPDKKEKCGCGKPVSKSCQNKNKKKK